MVPTMLLTLALTPGVDVFGGARKEPLGPKAYPAVYGCTTEDPTPHFLGWRNEVDPDALFKSGKAWGVTIRRVAAAPVA